MNQKDVIPSKTEPYSEVVQPTLQLVSQLPNLTLSTRNGSRRHPLIPSQTITTLTIESVPDDSPDFQHGNGADQPFLKDAGQITAMTKSTTIRSTCPYCGVGCGILATVDQTGSVSVQGDPDHPANFGKLCSKGSALAQTLGTERRLSQPYYNNRPNNKPSLTQNLPSASQQREQRAHIPTPAPWDEVLDDIASQLSSTIAKHGKDSVMFYVSGQLLSEDYYVANKLMKGFIGSNNIDSNSRLCMSSAVAGHKRAFGVDVVPGNYEDFEACDLLVLVGANMAWCHPILFGRFLAAKKANPHKKLIVIDPRRTDSCEFADVHLPIAVGTDSHLYNGLLVYLADQGCQDHSFTAHCEGLDDALTSASSWTIEKVAEVCQVDIELIKQFYKAVAETPKTVTAFSMGVNQSSSGTDKVNAITNSHLLTGRVGKVGSGPFSLTGQPNAMGGREVGALANLLAAHLELDHSGHRSLVETFWDTPQPISAEVGIKACDVADAILDGRIKAIWIMATNPVVSLPDADKFRRALEQCELVIVSDCSKDCDTVHCADIVLPAQGWGEKSGTVTNSERRISRQRQILPAFSEAKPDWWMLAQVAQRMGYSGFGYEHPSEVFNEYACLTGQDNDQQVLSESNDNSPLILDNNQPLDTQSSPLFPRHLNLLKAVIDVKKHMAADPENNADDHPKSKSRSDIITQNSLSTNLAISTSENPISFSLLSANEYDSLPPFQWGGERIKIIDATVSQPWAKSSPQPISLWPSAHFIAIDPPEDASSPVCFTRNSLESPPIHQQSVMSDRSMDLRLITGRLRDQWHTMTRTGLAPALNQQQSIPTLTLHPNDAEKLAVSEGSFVKVSPQFASESKRVSSVMAQVEVGSAMRLGDAFMPMHWSDAFANLARVNTLIPTKVDPHSHQPELKNTAIRVEPVAMRSVGKILVHPDWQDALLVQLRTLLAEYSDVNAQLLDNTVNHSMTPVPALIWSLTRQANCVLFQLASPSEAVGQRWRDPDFWQSFVQQILSQSCCSSDGYLSSPNKRPLLDSAFTVNEAQDQLRLVITQQQTDSAEEGGHPNQLGPTVSMLRLAVFIEAEASQLPSSNWLDSCFEDMSQLPDDQRYKWLLAGRPASGYVDPGPLVCSCMAVGKNHIIKAITEHNCRSAVAVGLQCQAGTNCGSCVGQINELIAEYA